MIQFHEDFAEDSQSPPGALFYVGQLVKHQRYRYRGVVVEIDVTCQASDAWYQKNQTQPNRDQPWYHVLVDKSGATTYAAQTSLEDDPSTEPIDHPLVSKLFSSFEDGIYLRNDVPWPPDELA